MAKHIAYEIHLPSMFIVLQCNRYEPKHPST